MFLLCFTLSFQAFLKPQTKTFIKGILYTKRGSVVEPEQTIPRFKNKGVLPNNSSFNYLGTVIVPHS